jgi:cysteine desulfurase
MAHATGEDYPLKLRRTKGSYITRSHQYSSTVQRIYFDNAATTALIPEVLEAMWPFLSEKFGNPSAIYSYGRETKLAIEQSRKTVARLLHANPGEIFFTSGGTESTNTAITAAIRDLGCTRIITSAIEHHATLHATQFVQQRDNIELSLVQLLADGHVDLEHLERLLRQDAGNTLVTLMHANNEIGNLLDIEKAGSLCRQYGAFFHCDTVQTVGHYPLNLKELQVDFINAAAHKFHGPKGVGLLYVNERIRIHPLLHGGAQERNLRAGTENIYGIVGMAKALELSLANLEADRPYILELKNYMAGQLRHAFPAIRFNGDWNGKSLYTILNVSFPRTPKSDMLLFNLDIHGICASGGSACASGANTVSHVISALDAGQDYVPVRFSFSRQNTPEEVDRVVTVLKELL